MKDRYEGRRPTRKQIAEAVTMMANANFDAVPSLAEAMGLEQPRPYPYMLTVAYPCKTEAGKTVPVGTQVEYHGHCVGGMVRVRLADGTKDVIHPSATKELRS